MGLGEITTLERVRNCGRVPVTTDGAVLLRGQVEGNGRAGYVGLVTCGSVWSCPVCSAKIARQRVAELEALLGWNARRDGSVALCTFTVSHYRGQALRTVWNGLSAAWTSLTTGSIGKHWRKLRALIGQDHYVRVTEVTYGDNGWHVHVHLLLLFDHSIMNDTATNLGELFYKLWHRALGRHGLGASRRHGVDVRRATSDKMSRELLAEYCSKLTLEAAGGRFKAGREGSRTPYEVLADGLESGLADDLELWLEWERASHGRRQMVWSRGLKTLAGVDEITDEDVASEDGGGETLLVLPRSTWRQVYPVAIELLEITEAAGIAGAMAWLDARGLTFEVNRE